MQPLYGYGAAYTILELVRDAVTLETQRRGIQFGRISIVPGAIAWDDCGASSCGLFALAAGRMYPCDSFPVEIATTDAGHGAIVAVDMTVQAIRCAPQPADRQLSPSVKALTDSAQQVADDQWAVYCATLTQLQALEDQGRIEDYMVRQSMMMGPEGACVGSELAFTVGLLPGTG